MDFSLTTLFVVPSDNVFPADVPTEQLAPKQFGVYGASYQTSIGNDPYFYLVQGRKENVPHTGSKRSAKIGRNKILSYYKVPAEQQTRNQHTAVSDFNIKCGQEVVVTVRAHSNYIDIGFANGYTQSVVVPAPCCGCGSDPCTSIDPVDIDKMLDDIVGKFGVAGPFMGGVFSEYITVTREGTGADARLIFEGKPLTPEGRLANISANPWEYDRLWFKVFVTKAPDTTQDFIVEDRCDQLATIETLDQYGYVRGSADEILHLEKYFYSYQSPILKTLHHNPDWNGAYESYVEQGLFYNLYYIKFLEYEVTGTWDNTIPIDQTVIVAVPVTRSAEFEARLAFLGQPVNYGGAPRPTTPSTSSSSSTNTSTSTSTSTSTATSSTTLP